MIFENMILHLTVPIGLLTNLHVREPSNMDNTNQIIDKITIADFTNKSSVLNNIGPNSYQTLFISKSNNVEVVYLSS